MKVMIKKYIIQANTGFTLIELVMIIVLLGILSSVAVVKYQDIGYQGKKSSTKSALGSLRTGISLYQTNKTVKENNSDWPPLDSLAQVGVVMLHQIPKNPFQSDNNAPDSIVLGITKGVVQGTRGGWAYKPSTGEIWANTNTTISGGGCSGDIAVGENGW